LGFSKRSMGWLLEERKRRQESLGLEVSGARFLRSMGWIVGEILGGDYLGEKLGEEEGEKNLLILCVLSGGERTLGL